MITYELAKQLKDAGFALKLCRMPDYPYECNEPMFGEFHYPKLSELIEACGDRFLRLVRYEAHDGTTAWRVNAYNNENDFIGLTPEEAVAKLWFAINKKNHE